MKKTTALLLFTILFSFAVNAQIKVECLSGNCFNGKGIKKYADGSAYDGEFLDSLRNGFGVIVWQSGDKYIGDFKANYITGKGTLIFKDGRIYEGDFFQNQIEGKGTMIYKDGSKYIGDWKSGNGNGKGTLIFKDGRIYEGDFVNNVFDGKGTMEWVEGSELKGDKYVGEFKKGQRNGKGKYIYANGTIEEGDFENDKFIDPMKKEYGCVSGDCENGIGTFNYKSDKETFTGKFKNGYAREGTLKNLDGIYKGQVFRWERDGFGTFTDNNGFSYTGNWKNNEITYGTVSDNKGTTYTGQLKRGGQFYRIEYDGEGTLIDGFHMGRTSKGYWKAGKLTGKAVQLYPNGYYMKAVFSDYASSNNDYSSSNAECFDNQNNQISYSEFRAKTPYQICYSGNCYNGIGICEYDFISKHFFIGYWVNGKKEGFLADFESATKYYYGIWKADTLVRKIDNKEAEKYLTANAKGFFNLLNSNKTFAAATYLIENCTTKTCTSGDCEKGFGTWEDCKGNTYAGNFTNGKFSGKGKFSAFNSNVYEGYFKNGIMSGKGKYKWADGSVYDGDWVNNDRTGKGKYTWANGDVYDGEWVNGVQQGKGEMTWQKKEYYIGDWVNGVRHGKGRSRDTENRIKEGDWVNDKFIITQAQREINEEIRYKIKQLREALESSRQSYLNAVSPSKAEDMEAYKRARERVKSDMEYAESEIYRLSKQIIE